MSSEKVVQDMETKPYGNLSEAKVLVIGHDPRLQKTDAIAEFAFNADLYFKEEKPKTDFERRQRGLARSMFDYIGYLTGKRFSPREVLVTNLCNKALPHAPVGKTVLIPEREAQDGLRDIRGLLSQARIEVIFAMSEQVNYWLQKLGFCPPHSQFLLDATPAKIGTANNPPYFKPSRSKAFQLICGMEFIADGKYRFFPILHAKNWPLRGKFKEAYEQAHERCVEVLRRH
jgi:hypothetical protein